MRTIEDVLNHLRAENMEMPGLRLKARQVQRAACPAITGSMLPLCSAPSNALRVTSARTSVRSWLRPRVPRGVRALTAPPRSANGSAYLMAG
jgi:hypothetical protein